MRFPSDPGRLTLTEERLIRRQDEKKHTGDRTMLSKKDHKAIAEIVERCSGPDAHWDYTTTYTADMVCDLADYFAQDNPQFDRERFLAACGL